MGNFSEKRIKLWYIDESIKRLALKTKIIFCIQPKHQQNKLIVVFTFTHNRSFNLGIYRLTPLCAFYVRFCFIQMYFV